MYLLNEALAREHSRELERRAEARRLRKEQSRERSVRSRRLRSAAQLRHRSVPAAAVAE